MKFWTDYPFVELGDISGALAPVREIEVLSYDDDKYCKIKCGEHFNEIKSGYIYTDAGRLGKVPVISRKTLAMLPRSE